ncbi:hypothetical protein [Actinoplanes siamensis]|uniref:Uncharacterized protein n=1 Tax=Actinoplanes siamensis TaxID=1223317 RepID=A0A919N648_9ACTN|nr:hypothetical protein [Actinoplanes siamensis]GIF05075.1 hypothetical protein Asi03nite_26130 [Actinoplanes siamensis]
MSKIKGEGPTTYGKRIGWQWDGCNQNDFIPYKLNNSYPGGVHHQTVFRWTSKLFLVDDMTEQMSVWGHYDGSCDH